MTTKMTEGIAGWRRRLAGTCLTLFAVGLPVCSPADEVDLADSPLFSTIVVPGNLALALSVEWPTGTTPAYTTGYAAANTYLGYFDPNKCYKYVYNAGTPKDSYFDPTKPYAVAHACTSTETAPLWSGNFLNWVAMQTLDTFRWTLTGGYRSKDTVTETILTKTNATYDSASVIPNKSLSTPAVILGATPLTWSSWNSRVRKLGTAVYFTKNNTGSSTWTGTGTVYTDYDGHNNYVDTHNTKYANPDTIYRIYINVKVCDPAFKYTDVGTGEDRITGEDFCKAYGSNFKPEGLMQKYAMKLRYSAFGYYNDNSNTRDGGVMRARMKFIGPKKPNPGDVPEDNGTPAAGPMEWDPSTGVMASNPDSADADATSARAAAAGYPVTISQSGVMNYLNKFGYTSPAYKSLDPSAELYYTATRYFRNLGSVDSCTRLTGAGSVATMTQWLDGFPAIANWDDPIPADWYCQKNFILGIGDTYSWYDTNLPGATIHVTEPGMPPEVTADTTVNARTATNMVGQLEGKNGGSLGDSWNSIGRGNGMFIAGLAYDAHTKDIRPDLPDPQTISTYWLDVHENAKYEHKNQYWLAAKYGGFKVPDGFEPYSATNNTTTLSDSAWRTNTDVLPFAGTSYATASGLTYSTDVGTTDKRPDNYFPGNSPALMKSGLTTAFDKIVADVSTAASSTMSAPAPRVTASGNNSYSAIYNTENWTSKVEWQTVAYDLGTGVPTYTDALDITEALDSQATRRIVTCCTTAGAALPFTFASLSGSALDPRTYYASFGAVLDVSAQSVSDYISYLRGNRALEVKNKDTGKYRDRVHLLGDVVDAKLVAVSPPRASYYESLNPGYDSFKSTYLTRKTVVYAGANDGMLHAFDGDPACGTNCELFGYIPSFTYGTAATAATSGLANLGSPTAFSHHYFVNATPVVTDVDFASVGGAKCNISPCDWRTLLVGGLGKGGKGYYAIDATDPSAWTSENAVAGKVLWEFTTPHMGYSYGIPTIVKIPQYGWTVIVSSGYNNDDGNGYLYFINPKTGALLETITLPGSLAAPLNVGSVSAYVEDYRDFTADSLYVGDLRGNLWRVSLVKNGSGSYDYSPLKFALLESPSGGGQPVTTWPLIEVDPNTGRRYVLVGTGSLLADSEISSSQIQTFYAIPDGKRESGKFDTGASFPITRSTLQPLGNDLLTGVSSATGGWYLDFTTGDGIAERVNVQPVATSDGIVGFAANLPNGEACSPAGTARVFVVSFGDDGTGKFGKTAIQNTSGTLFAYQSLSSSVTDVGFRDVGGKVRFYVGTRTGEVVQVGSEYEGAASLRRLNWREVPSLD